MAPYTAAQSHTNLRVVTQRLSTTPTKQLPFVASYLASSITECRKVFECSQSDVKDGSETGVIVHKLKTQLSALLQDRSPEARFSVVILIKAAVEVGGWSILQGVGPWVRGLIAIIGVSTVVFLKKHRLKCQSCLVAPSSLKIMFYIAWVGPFLTDL